MVCLIQVIGKKSLCTSEYSTQKSESSVLLSSGTLEKTAYLYACVCVCVCLYCIMCYVVCMCVCVCLFVLDYVMCYMHACVCVYLYCIM